MRIPCLKTKVGESIGSHLWKKIQACLPWGLAILGGISIGHASVVLGGTLDMDLFWKDYDPSRKLYNDRFTTPTTNFCPYMGPVLLRLSTVIPLTGCGSIWIAFVIYTLVHRERILHKYTLWVGICFLITGLSCVIWTKRFILGLALVGLSVGILRHIIPVSCAELVPSSKGKTMSRVYSYSVLAGELLAYFSNYMASTFLEEAWKMPFKVLFGVSVSLLFLCITMVIPELQIFQSYKTDVDEELNKLESISMKAQWRKIVRGRNRALLIINILATILPQLSGVGTIIFFMPMFLESMIDITESQSFMAPFIYTAIVLAIVLGYSETFFRRWRKKKWVMIASLSVMSLAKIGLFFVFWKENHLHHLHAKAKKILGVVLALLTIPGYSSLISPLGWTVLTYTPDVGVLGETLTDSLSMLITPGMNVSFLMVLCALNEKAFLVFGAFGMLTAIAVGLLIPNALDAEHNGMNMLPWTQHYIWRRVNLED